MSFYEFVYQGYDPCVNVVLLEDLAAVAGVVIAAGCMGLSYHTGSHVPDALGSLAIGGLLGAVASFMIYSNRDRPITLMAGLVGKRVGIQLKSSILLSGLLCLAIQLTGRLTAGL